MIDLVQQENKGSSSVKESLDDLFPTDEEEQTQSKCSSDSTYTRRKIIFEPVNILACQVHCHVAREKVSIQIQ